MNNFEAKHPRARDGKFTEKLRAESGVTLELGEFASGGEAEDLERGEIFIGNPLHYIDILGAKYATVYEHKEYDQIPPGQWQLAEKMTKKDGSFKLTYHHKDGIVVECFDKDGHIEKQVFKEKSRFRLQDANRWTEKNWNKDGILFSREKDFFPQVRNERTFKTISEAVDKAGGTLVTSEYFSDSGALDERRTWFKKDGQLYFASATYYEDGSIRSRGVSDFQRNACAPENTPSYVFYEDGELSLAEYMLVRDGESVYHRTDGPAIFSRSAPEGERERYFLEGVEYTKTEWEKKVGK